MAMPGTNMNASVTRPPTRPAPAMTVRAPKAAAAGPTIANDRGTPAVVIIQSRLLTRPISSWGTSRCMIVYQMTTRMVSADSLTSATSIACHTACAMPKPTIANSAIAHARYSAVIAFFGR